MIEKIPDSIDPSQPWLVDYWANEFGVSSARIRQAVLKAGTHSAKVQSLLNDGYRIAVTDRSKIERLVARVTFHSNGFGVSVPYASVKSGWIAKLPVQYAERSHFTPASSMKHFYVDYLVKLRGCGQN